MQLRNIYSVLKVCAGLRRKGATWMSVARYCWSEVASRLPRHLFGSRLQNGVLTLRFRNGLTLSFRGNKGDIQSIREIIVEEHYTLPGNFNAGVLIDLGANIGLTSIWLTRKYGFKTVIAVEPDPNNFELLKKNLKQNGIHATMHQAAAGAVDGEAFFSSAWNSNAGHLSEDGVPTKVVSMYTVMANLPPDINVDLVKMDIEGGEEELFRKNTNWLRRVNFIVTELHPQVCNTQTVIESARDAGFTFLPGAGLVKHANDLAVMDTFFKQKI